MNLLVRAVLSAAGRGFGSLVGHTVSGSVDCMESWERGRDAFHSGGQTFTTPPRPKLTVPQPLTSPGAVDPASQRAETRPTQETSPPTPSCVGQPNEKQSQNMCAGCGTCRSCIEKYGQPSNVTQPLTRAELQCAAFAVREWGASCGIGFGHQFWGGIADKLNAAAQKK